MEVHEYAEQDATGLAALLRDRQVSAAEVEAAARQALEVVNPHLNAIAGDPFAEVLDHDPGGLFGGVPFGIKDSSPAAIGVRSDYACRALDGYVPTSEPEIMTRFRSAGLASICRTTAPELHMYWTTESDMYGVTTNPWDTAMTSGGSSGGSASLVGARALPVASAGDAGGSTRMPAAYTGTVGLLPTTGRISYAPAGERLYGLVRPFAIVRSVRDVASLLDHLAGPVPGDRAQIPPPVRPYAEEVTADPAPMRIAINTSSPFTDDIDSAVIDGVLATGRLLESMGHEVVEASPPRDPDEIIDALVQAWGCGLASAVHHAMAGGRELDRDHFEPNTWLHIEAGLAMTVGDALGVYDRINAITRPIAQFFECIDMLIEPSVPRQAIPTGVYHGHTPFEDLHDLYRQTESVFAAFSTTWNITGQPAIVLPLHHDLTTAMPVSTQLVGRWGDEGRMLALSAALERALPWAHRVAPIDAAMGR